MQRDFHHRILAISLLTVSLNFVACTNGSRGSESQQSSFSYTEEPAFCSPVGVPGEAITITARAQFIARTVTSTGLQDSTFAQDIKFAEVIIQNGQGATVQCGTTDNAGGISLAVPKGSASYKIKIFSRANHASYAASVLNNPTQNLPYALEKDFSASDATSKNDLGIITARYDGTLLSGAFNILDQIYKANLFLQTNTSCPTRGDVCPAFGVAPPVRIYWTPGLSPYSYYGHPESPISFFIKADDPSAGIRRGMYIQGGIKSDFNCSDTDHFDNSVIIHEYGHFLEDAFARSDSPGGSHNGNFIIDPRLAWSEGWANFFQTAVLGSQYYRDTIGNSSCSGGTYLAVSLDLQTARYGQDQMLASTQVGEGIFREVSVARTLYGTMYSGGPNGGAGVGFSFIWKIFSDAQEGFRSSARHFRNIGAFNQMMRKLISTNDPVKVSAYDSALSTEYQLPDQTEYALPIRAQKGSTCGFSIQGTNDTYYMGEYYSNLLKSNDFFQYEYDGSNSTIELNYSGNSPSDLDLYLFTEDYNYEDPLTALRASRRTYPEQSGTGHEIVDLSGLPIGTYLINVRVNTHSLGGQANYFLANSQGERLCP